MWKFKNHGMALLLAGAIALGGASCVETVEEQVPEYDPTPVRVDGRDTTGGVGADSTAKNCEWVSGDTVQIRKYGQPYARITIYDEDVISNSVTIIKPDTLTFPLPNKCEGQIINFVEESDTLGRN